MYTQALAPSLISVSTSTMAGLAGLQIAEIYKVSETSGGASMHHCWSSLKLDVWILLVSMVDDPEKKMEEEGSGMSWELG